METIIRALHPEETGLLKDFLYEAIFLPPGVEPPDRSILDQPELALYYQDFGKGEADHAFVAVQDGRAVGAAWARIMDDYGHVDDETPSLAIALYPEYRGQGIGTRLLRELLAHLGARGYRRVSLAVQKANRAVHLYLALGFQTVRETGEEYIMVCDLGSNDEKSAVTAVRTGFSKIATGCLVIWGQTAKKAP